MAKRIQAISAYRPLIRLDDLDGKRLTRFGWDI